MQSHRELGDAEARAEVATDPRNHVDVTIANLVDDLSQVLLRQAAQILRVFDSV